MLPTLADIYSDDIQSGASDEKLNLLLSADPKPSWIRSREINGKEFKYLPIDKVEFLLRRIFGQFRIKVLAVNQIHGGVQVSVRVYYLLPPNHEQERVWAFQDGVGAVTLNQNFELEPAVPLAKTFAVKDACDHIGNIFGANLNRLDVITYKKDDSMDRLMASRMEIEKLYTKHYMKLKEDDKNHIERILNNREHLSYSKVLTMLNKL